MVTKEVVWKGLRLELTRNEIQQIYQAKEYELDDYYNYDLLVETLKMAVNKEIDFELFLDWCVLIANCFSSTIYPYKTKVGKLYDSVGYYFDGISFMEKYDKKDFLEDYAKLKDYDHSIKKAKRKIKGPFVSNGVERILCFDHANWNYDSCVYKLIIKDYNTKEWEIRYIDDYDFEYDESINYSFVNEKEFDKIFNKFYNEDSDWREVHNMKF
jgi:hypothetical protein